jgi:sugar O-acyltransferase (sialic acid O-acetyltransferase NeuD family)
MSRPLTPVAVIGAGGHAKVVISTLRAAGHTVGGVFDDDPRKTGISLLGVKVLGLTSDIVNTDYRAAVIAIGDNVTRRNLAQRIKVAEWITLVHPAAWVDPTVKLGQGTVVFAAAVIQPDTIVGDHVIINTGSTVDHDCVVGDFAHVAPGVHLAGETQLGEGALLGIGVVVKPCCRIGEWAIVGAGGVVVKDVPASVTAVGVPAVPRRVR